MEYNKLDINKEIEIVVYFEGEDEQNNNCYVYLKTNPANYQKLLEEVKGGTLDYKKYGKVLAEGIGEPSEALKKEMKEKYNCDDNFEKSLSNYMKSYFLED